MFTNEELEIIEMSLSVLIGDYESVDRGSNQMLTNNINEAKTLRDKVRDM